MNKGWIDPHVCLTRPSGGLGNVLGPLFVWGLVFSFLPVAPHTDLWSLLPWVGYSSGPQPGNLASQTRGLSPLASVCWLPASSSLTSGSTEQAFHRTLQTSRRELSTRLPFFLGVFCGCAHQPLPAFCLNTSPGSPGSLSAQATRPMRLCWGGSCLFAHSREGCYPLSAVWPVWPQSSSSLHKPLGGAAPKQNNGPLQEHLGSPVAGCVFSRAFYFLWPRCITVSDTAPLSQTHTWATAGRGGGLTVGSTKGDCDTRLEGSLRPGDLGLEGERELGQKKGLLTPLGSGDSLEACGTLGLFRWLPPLPGCTWITALSSSVAFSDLTCIPWPQFTAILATSSFSLLESSFS